MKKWHDLMGETMQGHVDAVVPEVGKGIKYKANSDIAKPCKQNTKILSTNIN